MATDADDAKAGSTDASRTQQPAKANPPNHKSTSLNGGGGGGTGGGGSGGGSGGGGGDGDQSGDDPDPAERTGWIEVALADDAARPVAGQAYAVDLPDGTVATGTTDENGIGRVDGFPPGSCRITFPDLDQDAWKPA